MARLALVALAALLPAASAARPAVAVGDIKAVDAKPQRFNEYVTLPGHKVKNDFTLKQPKDYVNKDDLPKSYSWANVNGKSLVTKSLNQHIPQCALRVLRGGGGVGSLRSNAHHSRTRPNHTRAHTLPDCGSCWAHGAASALADRIKIARNGAGIDINLAIQYILSALLRFRRRKGTVSKRPCTDPLTTTTPPQTAARRWPVRATAATTSPFTSL